MKKTIAIIGLLLIQLTLIAQVTTKEKEELDYVVLANNDTLYGFVGMFNRADWGSKCKFTPKGGEKTSYSNKEAKAFRKNGIEYEVNLKEPQYGVKGNRDFVKIMLRNGNFKLYEVEQGGGSGGVSVNYYLMENENFVEHIKRNNYEELIPKYFGNCEVIAKAMKLGYTKFKDLDQLSLHYYQGGKCK
ncbi:MAG: hypothetical protein ACXVC9_12255 [Bacteroidia bacterium]